MDPWVDGWIQLFDKGIHGKQGGGVVFCAQEDLVAQEQSGEGVVVVSPVSHRLN